MRPYKNTRISRELDEIFEEGKKRLNVSKVQYSRLVAQSGCIHPEDIIQRKRRKRDDRYYDFKFKI